MRQGSVHCQIIGFGIDIDHIIDVADLARSAKGKTRCKIVGWRRIRSKCCGDLFYRNGGRSRKWWKKSRHLLLQRWISRYLEQAAFQMTQRDPAANQPDISVDTPQAPRKASAVFRKAALQVPRLSGHSRSAAAPDRCNRLYRFCTDRVRAALFPSSFSSNRESPSFS